MIKLLTVEEEILRDTDELTRVMRSIQSSINDVPDSSCRLILEMRYLAFMKWEDIASEKASPPGCLEEGRIFGGEDYSFYYYATLLTIAIE